MATNDAIADALIRHQIGLQRLSTATVRKVLAELRRADARLVERLARESLTEIGRKRQEALLRDIRAILDAVYVDARGVLQFDVEALAEYEAEYTHTALTKLVQADIDFTLPGTEQIRAAVNSRPFQGRLLKDWYAEWTESAQRGVRNAIRAGIVEGQSTSDVIRAIRGTRAQGYKDGVLGIGRRQAETVVRTAMAHTANAANQHYFEANQQRIKALKWVAVLDGRTSAVCRGRDGMTWAVDKGPRPPAHPNCRSLMLPVLKSARALGVRDAGLDGQPPADTTYSDWLRKQPVKMQNDILGVKKATLFRNGGVDLDRFIDRKGRELSLDELKAQEAEAWRQAGLD